MNAVSTPSVFQRLPTISGLSIIVFSAILLSIPETNAAPLGALGAGGVRSAGAASKAATTTGTAARATTGTATGTAARSTTGTATRSTTGAATRSTTATATRTTTGSRHGYRPAHRPGHRPGHLPAYGHRHYAARHHARHHYHRWYRAAAWFALGAYVATRPRYTTTVYVSGTQYYYTSGVYYVSSGTGYKVVAAPAGAVVYAVPTATTVVYASSSPYYYYGGTFYVATDEKAAKPTEADVEGAGEEDDYPPMTEDDHNYKVVSPPVGATVPYLPDEAKEETIKAKKYWVYENTYYQAFASEGDTIYMVVENPK